MSENKLCPKCGLDYDTCETCGKEGCFDCIPAERHNIAAHIAEALQTDNQKQHHERK